MNETNAKHTSEGGKSRRQRSVVGTVIRFCLENKLVVLLCVFTIAAAGILVAPFDWRFEQVERYPVPVDAIPDIGENQQIVFTQWRGRSPQDVDDQISYPLTVSLLGVPGVKTIRSYSMFGFSSIYIIFDEDVDFHWSRSRILEKLNSLSPDTLPEGVQPSLGPDATALGQIYWYTLEGRDSVGNPTGGWSREALRTFQDWYVRYWLLSAEGVAEVGSIGGFVKEYQLNVDPAALRAYDVTLDEVVHAVKSANLDVGAKTLEINRVEYFIRGIGFIEKREDIEDSVVKVRGDNVPVLLKHVAEVTTGPAGRRGALDKGGAPAVGGVVVARYGENPLAVIKAVKEKIEETRDAMPSKVLIDCDQASRKEVEEYARSHGFDAYTESGVELDQERWLSHLRSLPRDAAPKWATISTLTVDSFYDRTGLIYETLGTLNDAISHEILITIVVVLLMVMHLRSSLLISSMLPLAVLLCFIGMKLFGIQANIVALSGIVIAIGTIVDMGIVVCENILQHIASARKEAAPDRLSASAYLDVVHRAAGEVAGAVITAVLTTIVSFLPVFTMIGAEGKLFKPLAWTKTFALIASIIIAITVLPPAAHVLFRGRFSGRKLRRGFAIGTVAAVVFVGYVLTRYWEPLGPERGILRNSVFVGVIIGVLLGFFKLFQWSYPHLLKAALRFKMVVLFIPLALIACGFLVWLGPAVLFGPLNEAPGEQLFGDEERVETAVEAELVTHRGEALVWTAQALKKAETDVKTELAGLGIETIDTVLESWRSARRWDAIAALSWEEVSQRSLATALRWTTARSWNGLGKEFMPPLDEGSFLWMPTTMTHASIGEALDILQKQDILFEQIPEVESAVGKIGRAETPLDPAPVSMIETVINYKPEYKTDKNGRRITFQYDRKKGEFVRDENGALIPDPGGLPFRQWRDHIKSPDDIWDEIVKAGKIPGTTSAPKLQPIAARIVMLQSGMRAPMGVKIKGADLETLEKTALQIERFLKEVPSVEPAAVIADRIVGKPYLEIHPRRRDLARYGVPVEKFQEVVEAAIGGRHVTRTVEGRERFPVLVRYQRELRDSVEAIERILIAGQGGQQVPLGELADIRYRRGPQVIKTEDTFAVAYVVFDKKPGFAEVDVVRQCRDHLRSKIESGGFSLPPGVSYSFAGSYENQVRAARTLAVILPLALFIIFMIIYLQFKSVSTTLLVFSGIFVAWSGGFLLIWLYGQPWFLDFSVFGVGMRSLFQIHTINMSVAVWVGFLALFGIATDDGVIQATYLNQVFGERKPKTREEIREATVAAASRRVRPCLMTSATTILALVPVLTSTGRGSDVMVPMAIPAFGGMLVVLISIFVVPILYCWIQEIKHR